MEKVVLIMGSSFLSCEFVLFCVQLTVRMKCVIMLLKLCYNDVRLYMAIFYFFIFFMLVM